MRPVLLAFLAACVPATDAIAPPTVPDGGLRVSFEIEEEDADNRLRALSVSISELVFEANGPGGPAAVTVTVEEEWDLLASSPAFTVLLRQGAWREVSLDVILTGLSAAGEGWQIDADRLVFHGETATLDVPEGADPRAVVRLKSAEWVDELEDDDDVAIAPGSPGYDAVVERIESSEVEFSGPED